MAYNRDTPRETYDDLVRQRSVRLARVLFAWLPERVFVATVGKLLPDPETIRACRAAARDDFQNGIAAYRSLCAGLAVPRRADVGTSSQDLAAEEGYDPAVIDAWIGRSEAGNGTQAVTTQMAVLTSRQTQAKTVLRELEDVLAPERHRYLRADEQQQLITALKTVVAIIDALESRRDDVRTTRRDAFITTVANRVQTGLDSVDAKLTPSRINGRRLQHADQLQKELSALHDEITPIRTGRVTGYLRADQRSRLDELLRRIDTRKRYIDAKTAFDTHILRAEHALARAQRAAQPYLEYETYLTRPAADALETALKRAATTIDTLRDAVDIEPLTAPDQDRLSTASDVVPTIRDHLDGYNERFVSREREQYQALFSDIGTERLSLTPAQERAVIRNGIYNQVIAAAGTGKTLALTTRVAYLIASQDVPPERILVVTFTSEAAEEMQTRLDQHFGITDVEVETVHAFGYSVINEADPDHPDVVNQNQVLNLVDRIIREAQGDAHPEFLEHYYDFLVHFDDVYLEETEFETKKAYVEARRTQRYTTLRGEEVRSRAEKHIADFLFIHRVPYQYENTATWAETADDKGAYDPDFYLPEHDIYIEHWGIDAASEVAPWFETSSETYIEKMHWARETFAEAEATLVETYEFEQQAGRLRPALQARLEQLEVDLDQRSFQNLITEAFDYNRRESWIKRRFVTFIQNARRFGISPDDITSALNADNPRQYHFGLCGIYLLEQYERYLEEHGFIDFTDMINRSRELIQQDPDRFRSRYDHVLVDEFQDLGKGQLELLKELTGVDGPHLFAVGDDWQSIYSFQGAIVQYFIDFNEQFGPPVQTVLNQNYRSPPAIIDAGNELIDHNEDQIDKTVHPTVEETRLPLVHSLQGSNFWDYVNKVSMYTVDLVLEYLEDGAAPDDIMILCRFDGAVQYLDDIKTELRERLIPYEGKSGEGKSDEYHGSEAYEGHASVYSIYQSKGREADHVILVNAVTGRFGFPPSGRDDELLEPVKPFEVDKLAEERRGFYVSITRSGATLDILTREGHESQFIDDIGDLIETVDRSEAVEPLDDVGSLMTVTARFKQLFDDVHRKKHQDGIIVDQYGGSARLISWASTNPPTLIPDRWYRFEDVRVDEYKDREELVITADSTVEEVREPR